MSSGGKSRVPLGGSVVVRALDPIFPVVPPSFSLAATTELPDVAELPDIALIARGGRTVKTSAEEHK